MPISHGPINYSCNDIDHKATYVARKWTPGGYHIAAPSTSSDPSLRMYSTSSAAPALTNALNNGFMRFRSPPVMAIPRISDATAVIRQWATLNGLCTILESSHHNIDDCCDLKLYMLCIVSKSWYRYLYVILSCWACEFFDIGSHIWSRGMGVNASYFWLIWVIRRG